MCSFLINNGMSYFSCVPSRPGDSPFFKLIVQRTTCWFPPNYLVHPQAKSICLSLARLQYESSVKLVHKRSQGPELVNRFRAAHCASGFKVFNPCPAIKLLNPDLRWIYMGRAPPFVAVVGVRSEIPPTRKKHKYRRSGTKVGTIVLSRLCSPAPKGVLL